MKPVINSMTHRWCPGCKSTKKLNDFHKNHRDRLGVTSYCKVCSAIKMKRYVGKNKLKRREAKAKLILEFGNQCIDCKATNLKIDSFVFHHHTEKMNSTSYRLPSDIITTINRKLISDEKKKWILLCANCHSVRHGCGLTANEIMSN